MHEVKRLRWRDSESIATSVEENHVSQCSYAMEEQMSGAHGSRWPMASDRAGQVR